MDKEFNKIHRLGMFEGLLKTMIEDGRLTQEELDNLHHNINVRPIPDHIEFDLPRLV